MTGYTSYWGEEHLKRGDDSEGALSEAEWDKYQADLDTYNRGLTQTSPTNKWRKLADTVTDSAPNEDGSINTYADGTPEKSGTWDFVHFSSSGGEPFYHASNPRFDNVTSDPDYPTGKTLETEWERSHALDYLAIRPFANGERETLEGTDPQGMGVTAYLTDEDEPRGNRRWAWLKANGGPPTEDIMKTYLKVTRNIDGSGTPNVQVVTLTLKVGETVSTEGGDADTPGIIKFEPAKGQNVSLSHVEVGSRDKYLGGSFDIPAGWETLEMEFVNKTSGENLGRYGSLDGSGTTKIYHSVTEPLGDSEETASASQPESQKVWFVKPEGGGALQFFTCFNDTGEVEVRLYLKGTKIGALPRTLTPAPDFASTIRSVDNWVKGYGFDFGDSTPSPLALFAGNGGSTPAQQPISNYTRAVLLPFFLVASQVEGLTELVGGAADGIYAGLKDDVALLKLVVSGVVKMEAATRAALEQEIHKWRTDPYKRARELKAISEKLAEECVFRPLKEKASDIKKDIADWPNFVRKSITIWTQPNDAQKRSWVVTKDIWSETVKGVTSWVDDFGNRMVAGAESQHWLREPWGENNLIADFVGTGLAAQRVMVYTLGYDVGYILEQVAMGKGLGVAGKALIKGGVKLASQLTAKVMFTVAARGQLLKRLTTGVISKEVRDVFERELARAAGTPLIEGKVAKTWAEIIEEGMAKAGFDRTECSIKKVVEAACTRPNIKKLMMQEGAHSAFTQRMALFFHLMGGQVDAKIVNNFIKVFDEKLIVSGEGGLVKDWSQDFFLALEGSPSRLVSRPVVTTLSDEAKAILKEVIDPEGSLWKSPPIGFGPRGLITEAHLAYTEYKGFTWSPTRATVDFVEEGIEFVNGATAVQLKTLSQNTSSSGLKTAIRKLSQLNDTSISQRILDIRKKPGLDTTALVNELENYMRANPADVPRPVTITVKEYEFATP
jgi:hypothetical protein